MDRRGLLRALSSTAAAAVLPPGSLDRLVEVAQAVGRSRRVDAGLPDRLEDLTSSLAQRFYDARPEDLTGAVRGLTDTSPGCWTTGAWSRAAASGSPPLAADAHLFAGQLALDADLRGDARAYFRLAGDLAREAGDGVLHSLALDADGRMYALRTPDGQRGDPQRAIWQISQAHASLPEDAPHSARAWPVVDLARHRDGRRRVRLSRRG